MFNFEFYFVILILAFLLCELGYSQSISSSLEVRVIELVSTDDNEIGNEECTYEFTFTSNPELSNVNNITCEIIDDDVPLFSTVDVLVFDGANTPIAGLNADGSFNVLQSAQLRAWEEDSALDCVYHSNDDQFAIANFQGTFIFDGVWRQQRIITNGSVFEALISYKASVPLTPPPTPMPTPPPTPPPTPNPTNPPTSPPPTPSPSLSPTEAPSEAPTALPTLQPTTVPTRPPKTMSETESVTTSTTKTTTDTATKAITSSPFSNTNTNVVGSNVILMTDEPIVTSDVDGTGDTMLLVVLSNVGLLLLITFLLVFCLIVRRIRGGRRRTRGDDGASTAAMSELQRGRLPESPRRRQITPNGRSAQGARRSSHYASRRQSLALRHPVTQFAQPAHYSQAPAAHSYGAAPAHVYQNLDTSNQPSHSLSDYQQAPRRDRRSSRFDLNVSRAAVAGYDQLSLVSSSLPPSYFAPQQIEESNSAQSSAQGVPRKYADAGLARTNSNATSLAYGNSSLVRHQQAYSDASLARSNAPAPLAYGNSSLLRYEQIPQ